MKKLIDLNFNVNECKQELDDFRSLLSSNQILKERKDVIPFFKKQNNLAAFFGSYVPRMHKFDRLAYEYSLCGDFIADIVIGDSVRRCYLLVELEDASENSVFVKRGTKTTREWAPRFAHGFGQLVDWFCKLDGLRNTPDFQDDFGTGVVEFQGMLVIGRRANFKDDSESRRFHWFSDRLRVDSHSITCLTYDDVLADLTDDIANSISAYRAENLNPV